MMTCPFYRLFLSASIDSGQAPAPGLARHLERCPGCRVFFERERELVRSLSTDRPSSVEGPSVWLRGRVMARVRASANPRERRSRMPALLWPALAGAASVILAAVFLAGGKNPSQPPQAGPTVARMEKPAAPATAAVDSSANPAMPLLRFVNKLDEPLETELTSVVNDARTALNSLAYNFVPGKTIERF